MNVKYFGKTIMLLVLTASFFGTLHAANNHFNDSDDKKVVLDESYMKSKSLDEGSINSIDNPGAPPHM